MARQGAAVYAVTPGGFIRNPYKMSMPIWEPVRKVFDFNAAIRETAIDLTGPEPQNEKGGE